MILSKVTQFIEKNFEKILKIIKAIQKKLIRDS